ncbi:glycosyltransferase family 1 protein [Eggerthella timonensis]|uniref:glycosyltransferase family 1 protein n=1 Tax=Eggerthella timonensis TaxID=1871008 RepID=UPI0011AF1523|nr:glycosyltransferase family 1 protein [Eggerthella timonensis]
MITDYLTKTGADVTTYVFPITFRTKRYADNPQPNHKYAKCLFVNYYERLMGRLMVPLTRSLLSRVIRKSCNIDFDEYDWIILESGICVALVDVLPEKTFFIYRQSDPVDGILSKNKYLIECERKVLRRANLVLTVSDAIQQKYVNEGYDNVKLWKNGFQSTHAITWFNPYDTPGTKAVYFGLYFIDHHLIKQIAEKLPHIEFHIIGPYKDKVKCKNVVFHGWLSLEEYSGYLQHSDFAIVPYLQHRKNSIFPVTSKMYQFLDHRLPIVALATDAMISFSRETRDVYPCSTPIDFVETIKNLERLGYPFYDDFELDYFTIPRREEELKMILSSVKDVHEA